jgi:hypothetical protein
VGGGLPCLWRDGRRATTRLQLLVPLELGWQRASRGARAVQFGTYGHPTSAVAVEVAVAGGRWAVGRRRPWAVGRAWTTWLSGPASDGRRQRLVNDSSAHWQCVVEKQGLYLLQLRGKLQKRAISVQTDGWTDERTKVFSRKALVEIGSQLCCSRSCRCPQTTSSVDTIGEEPALPHVQDQPRCHNKLQGRCTWSNYLFLCDKMSRDAVRDRTVEQYDYRRTAPPDEHPDDMVYKGSYKKRRPVEWRLALQVV